MKIHSSIVRKSWWAALTKLVVFFISLRKKQQENKTAFDRQKVNRILVVRTDRIGDLILVTPAIRALRENFPSAFIAVLSSKYNKKAIAKNKDVEEVICYNEKRLFLPWNFMSFVSKLRKYKFDMVIDTYYPFFLQSAFLSYLSSAEYRVGYDSKYSNVFFNLHFKGEENIYEAKRHTALLENLGLKISSDKLILETTDEDEKNIKVFLDENKLNGNNIIVGINPGARRSPHRWDVKKFAKLADDIIKEYNAKVIVTWGPGEKELAESVLENMEKQAIISCKTTINEIASLMKYMKLFVCPDTSVYHVAVAAGVPIVSIVGKGDASRWAPAGNNKIYIVKGKKVKDISVEDVMLKVQEALK